MSAAGFFRLATLKGRGIVSIAARHNRRAIQAELGASSTIDPTRSSRNFTLAGPDTPQAVAALAKALMAEAGVVKLRKNAVLALELVFSLPPSSAIDFRSYFTDCLAWVCRNFGGDRNVLSADVHLDEAAPHCHVLVLPLSGGRMAGSQMAGDKHRLLTLHADFQLTVASRYGLKKAQRPLSGNAKREAAKQVLSSLKASCDSVLRSSAWPTIRDSIERDPTPFVVALGIELDEPKKPMRTMTQIFTSKGKGKATETPIGISRRQNVSSVLRPGARARESDEGERSQSLCSVGLAANSSPEQDACAEVTRERDTELDPALFDATTGEFIQPAPASPMSIKLQAREWVTQELDRLHKAAANDELGPPQQSSRSFKG